MGGLVERHTTRTRERGKQETINNCFFICIFSIFSFLSFFFFFFGPLFAPRQHPLAPTPHNYGQATCVALREDTALCTARQTKPRVAQRRRRRRRRLLGTCFLSAADLKESWVPPCPRRRKRTGRWEGSGLRGAAAAGGSGRNPGACGRVCCGEKDLVRLSCRGWD